MQVVCRYGMVWYGMIYILLLYMLNGIRRTKVVSELQFMHHLNYLKYFDPMVEWIK